MHYVYYFINIAGNLLCNNINQLGATTSIYNYDMPCYIKLLYFPGNTMLMLDNFQNDR